MIFCLCYTVDCIFYKQNNHQLKEKIQKKNESDGKI
ncbi:hypothetical protein EDC45_1800 [Mesocricetibacter intestinalis]|uniref:Uncharacterized protein n=1 Tax=Mesocricetibacter intestinalis TaxID=1521930 RepID=A0A4R6VAK6_9PAST|nr:hypothetical protein EDC45_1800 [Mesocricetibacter intestinalis]